MEGAPPFARQKRVREEITNEQVCCGFFFPILFLFFASLSFLDLLLLLLVMLVLCCTHCLIFHVVAAFVWLEARPIWRFQCWENRTN
jgi:hypothetical protein